MRLGIFFMASTLCAAPVIAFIPIATGQRTILLSNPPIFTGQRNAPGVTPIYVGERITPGIKPIYVGPRITPGLTPEYTGQPSISPGVAPIYTGQRSMVTTEGLFFSP